MKKVLLIGASLVGLTALAACQDDAQIVNHNLTKAADNFELVRNVVFYNTWIGEPVLSIVGVCSVTDSGHKFQVTCKEPNGTYTRRQMGRNANMTYYLDQVEGVDVSAFHSRVTFKPQSMLPDIDFRGSAEELLTNHSEVNQ